MAMAGSFMFKVNKSFLDQSDHPITVPKRSHDAVRRLVGTLNRERCSLPMINATGVIIDASIRHSVSGWGDYYQVNTGDTESTDGLNLGQSVHVELWSEPLEVRLVTSSAR